MMRLFRAIGYGIAMLLLAILITALWRLLLWMIGVSLTCLRP
jgi:hypothetical protein